MAYICEWCGSTEERIWLIPPYRDRGDQWVCKSCHSEYFNGYKNAEGEMRQQKLSEL